jgi:hypothetical protein
MRTVDDLRTALRVPAEAAHPDAGAIIRRARRRRATRRAVAGGSALAVVTALAVTAALVPRPPAPPEAGPRPPTGSGGSGAVGAAPDPVLVAALARFDPPVEAPSRFDPLVRTLHVGWIPPGLGSQSAGTSPWEQTYAGFDRTYVNGGPDVGLVVTILARGRPLGDLSDGALGLPLDAVARPTDPIHGRPAECLSDPLVPGSCSALRWRYAPDAWARVSYAGTAGPTPAEAAAVARRVAESVSLTGGDPVRMPFAIEGRLASMRVGTTHVSVSERASPGLDDERWSASVYLVDDYEDLRRFAGARALGIGVRSAFGDPSGRIGRDGRPNTTVDGHPAHLGDDGRSLVIWGVNRTRVSVDFIDRPGRALVAYRDVRLVETPNDPTDWIPVR